MDRIREIWRSRGRERWLPWALALLAAAVAAATVLSAPGGPPRQDERDYFRAAAHLARGEGFSHAPLGREAPPPDAYREPGYAALVAAAWRVTGVAVPERLEELAGSGAGKVVRVLNLLLLFGAGAGSALAVRRSGGGRLVAAAAGATVLLSPALTRSAAILAAENLAAPLLAAAGAGLVGCVARGGERRTPVWAAGAAAGLAALTRGAALAAVPAGAVVLGLLPRALPRRRRAARAALFAAVALAPVAAWSARNRAVLGHGVLADRTGAVLLVRAELDREIAREGVPAALRVWTPLDPGRGAGADGRTRARLLRYEWTGEGNYFTRAIRRWRAEREGSGDPLGADRRLARAALAELASEPLRHLGATLAVSWRGLFAEEGPRWLAPLDLRLPIGIGLLLANLALVVRASRRRDPRPLVLLALPAALFALHALATEFLPRFGVPTLPLVWAGAWLGLAGFEGPGEPGEESGTGD